jgi:hypothetical protein
VSERRAFATVWLVGKRTAEFSEFLRRDNRICVAFPSQLRTFDMQVPQSPKKAAIAAPLSLPLSLAMCVISSKAGGILRSFHLPATSNEGIFK